jgi:repressor LexA
MTMGEYIKLLRTQKGLSQEELGKMVGVNRAAVNKWEQGTVENIKRSTIKKLSQVFGVSPCDLMQWDDEANIKQVQNEVDAFEMFEQAFGKEALTAITTFLKLDEIDRGKITERMETLLEDEKYSVKKESKHA